MLKAGFARKRMMQMLQLIKPKSGYTGLTVNKQSRNSMCACGSGKKAKKCHGTNAQYYSREQLKKTLNDYQNGQTKSKF